MNVSRRRILQGLAGAPLLPALGQTAPSGTPPTPAPSPTPRAVDGAARLLAQVVELRHGAQLAPGDVDVIAAGVGDALEGHQKLRALRLGNADEPVTVFRARLPAGPPSQERAPATTARASLGTPRPAAPSAARSASTDLAFASVRELGHLLRARRVSARELCELSLERLERHGPRLGALVTLTAELAREQARRADDELRAGHDRGPLHGIPYGAKDLLATRGIPTSWGAEPLREQIFDYDATAITRLREAGAVLVAKLAMVELAGGMGYDNPDASFTGPGRTPWHPDYWSGGSSSGSGAAVAAGLVPFALGSETSGSILTPAAFCGLTGLRPTYGLVSRHGAMALSWTLDKLGPLTRSADDAGLVLEALAGPDPRDPSTTGDTFAWDASESPSARPRIGVVRYATASAIPEVRAAFEASVEALRAFADVEDDVPFPDFPWGPTVATIVDAEGASAFRDLIESGATRRLRAKSDRTGGYVGLVTLAVDYLDALRARGPMRAALDELLGRYDALVLPTRSGVAPPIGYDFDKPPQPLPTPAPDAPRTPAVVPAGNLCGLPAVALPNGFGPHGLPTSLELLGRAFSERTLLALAQRYQQATDWHLRRPPLPA